MKYTGAVSYYVKTEWVSILHCSWFLRKHPIFVRTSHDVYLERATIFIEQVISRVKDLQFYTANGKKGGPIIMTQVYIYVIVQGDPHGYSQYK